LCLSINAKVLDAAGRIRRAHAQADGIRNPSQTQHGGYRSREEKAAEGGGAVVTAVIAFIKNKMGLREVMQPSASWRRGFPGLQWFRARFGSRLCKNADVEVLQARPGFCEADLMP
jgi:hypothetical protein